MNDDLLDKADEMLNELKQRQMRASVDRQSGKLGAKIRKGETDKIPHMVILGQREVEDGKVSLRSRNNPEWDGSLPLDEFIARIENEISSKALPKQRESS